MSSGTKGQQQQQTLGRSEQWRIDIEAKLDAWIKSESRELKFPPELSKEERKYLHEWAPRLGLLTKSSGSGSERYITVSKPNTDASIPTIEIKLSGNSYRAVRTHCSRYPSTDETQKKTIEEISWFEASTSTKKKQKIKSIGNTTQQQPQKPKSKAKNAAVAGKQLQQLQAGRKKLPAYESAEKVQEFVLSHGVILISGATGCGKSTQVPQYVLDALKNKASIACSQPRRLSAIAVAERVAAERGEKLGESIGYEVRFEKCYNPESGRLLFATPGVLLRKLANSELSEYTHLIIDEVHEEDRDTEFLVIAARELAKRGLIRLILMSATLALEKLQRYFNGCPAISMGGRTFPVDAIYLEHILKLCQRTHHNCMTTPSNSNSQLTEAQRQAVATLAQEKLALRCVLCGKRGFGSARELGDHVADCDGIDLSADDLAEENGDASGIRDDMAVVMDVAASRTNRFEEIEVEQSSALIQNTEDNDDFLDLSLDPRGFEQSRLLHTQHNEENNNTQMMETATEAEVRAYQRSIDDESVDTALVVDVVKYIVQSAYERAAILIFVSGWADIVEVCGAIEADKDVGSICTCVQLHSSVETAKQRQAFAPPDAEKWKIVVATNVAETSITIPDVAFVIDTGLEKTLAYDPLLGASVLRTHRIARASADQRMGRAGRTRPGLCFRLWTTRRHRALESRRKSELLRANLEGLCLQAAALDLPFTADALPLWQNQADEHLFNEMNSSQLSAEDGDRRLGAREFLRRAVNPPEEKNIDRAILSLLDMGALHRKDERPSALGKALARLPLPPRLGLAAYYARLLNSNNDDLLALPCLLETKDPYTKLGAAGNKARAAASVNCPHSDVAALVGAYAGFRRNRSGSANYCRSNGLNYAALTLVHAAVAQLKSYLGGSNSNAGGNNAGGTNRMLVPALSAVALYPNIGHRKPGDHGYTSRTGAKCRMHNSALANKKNSPYSSFSASKANNSQFLCFGSLLEYVDTNGRSGLAVATVAPAEPLALFLLCHATIIRQDDDSLLLDNWLCIKASDKKLLDSLLLLRQRLRLALAKLIPPSSGLDTILIDAVSTVAIILTECASGETAGSGASNEDTSTHGGGSGRRFSAFTPFASTQQQGAAQYQALNVSSGSRSAGRSGSTRASGGGRSTAAPIQKNPSNNNSYNNRRQTSSSSQQNHQSPSRGGGSS